MRLAKSFVALSILLLKFMVFPAQAIDGYQETWTYGDFLCHYDVHFDVTIVDYTGSDSVLIIPDTINSMPVIAIGNEAFENCTSLTSVTIPDSVRSIGAYAFGRCYSLADIVIGNGVTSIGSYAFWDCSNLTSVTIPDSVTEILNNAFSDCGSLTNVAVPDSVTLIGEEAFGGCVSLMGITIPAAALDRRVFPYCSNLADVSIGSDVTSIDALAFLDCSGLVSVNVSPANASFSSQNGVLFNKDQTELIQYPQKRSGDYTIPNSVTSIVEAAFYNCTEVTNITIGSGVTVLGSWGFADSPKLTGITVPGGVKKIEGWAFSGCYSLEYVYFYGDPPELGTSVFQGATNATVYRVADAIGWPVVPDEWGECPTAFWDSDGDGISDPWEALYFGNPTNANPNDVCANGMDTVGEAYIAGLDPNDPQSALNIRFFPDRSVQWSAVSGRFYSVYWSTNLQNGFQCLESNIPCTQTVFTNLPAGPCGYGKIAVRLAE